MRGRNPLHPVLGDTQYIDTPWDLRSRRSLRHMTGVRYRQAYGRNYALRLNEGAPKRRHLKGAMRSLRFTEKIV